MSISFSFGTYRTTYKNPYHKKALEYAVKKGINHIDTSSNYMDGQAEILIGEVLKNKKREDFKITSKGGYIQGDNLQRILDGWEVNEIVKYNESCYHSISPMFLKDQIQNSLKRLQSKYIDIYLLHNPEYYLIKNINEYSSKEDIEYHQNIMQLRIKKAFEFLEDEVKSGTIKGYGISSNSFAKNKDHIHFLEYKNLIKFTKEYGGENHNFKAIQFPMNPFEVDGEDAGIWAKQNHIKVQINRPLNAFSQNEMLRLATYNQCEEFDSLLKEVQTIPNNKMQKLISQLLDAKHNFSWAGQVDDTIDYQTIPFILEQIKLEKEYHELMYKFIRCYKKSVKHEMGKMIALRLNMKGSIDKQAIEFLKQKDYISNILIGMRDIEYVDRVLSY
jgi:aryl-alcohol dehydrogenase-like predicted oxidoreductase